MKFKVASMGYYWVKHYNSDQLQVMYFNGLRFESFPSENFIHDEIESYTKVSPPESWCGAIKTEDESIG